MIVQYFIVNKNTTQIWESINIYKILKNNLDILIDDTDENLFSKIKKFNLLGIHIK